jgi:hypothetical protein
MSRRNRNKNRVRRNSRRPKIYEGKQSCYIFSLYPYIDTKTGDFKLESYEFEVEERDVPHVPLYDRAHELMPSGYWYESEGSGREVDRALEILDKPETDKDDWLRAIGILGHSPCQRSFEALGRWANADEPQASVARMALGECAGLARILAQHGGATGFRLFDLVAVGGD